MSHDRQAQMDGVQCPRCKRWNTQSSWVNGECFNFQCLDCGHIRPNGTGITRGES